MRINKETVLQANKNFLSVEELVYIYTVFINEDWEMKLAPAAVNRLVRMGLLKDPKTITPEGEEVLAACSEQEVVTVEKTDKFEEFWSLYPKSDGFDRWPATRILRYSKPKTKEAYHNTIASGITHERLMKALKREIGFRSRPSSSNEFKYMNNSVNYLKTQAYMNYDEDDEIEETLEHGKEIV